MTFCGQPHISRKVGESGEPRCHDRLVRPMGVDRAAPFYGPISRLPDCAASVCCTVAFSLHTQTIWRQTAAAVISAATLRVAQALP